MGRLTVSLTEEEIGLARKLADGRSKPKENYESTRHYTDDEDEHFHGVLGEMAYAKHYGVELDDSCSVLGDNGIDMTILGYTVDVKTVNLYDPPILKLYSLHDWKANLYALARRVENSVIELCGFTNAETMCRHFVVRDFGKGKRVCLEEKWLFFSWQIGVGYENRSCFVGSVVCSSELCAGAM